MSTPELLTLLDHCDAAMTAAAGQCTEDLAITLRARSAACRQAQKEIAHLVLKRKASVPSPKQLQAVWSLAREGFESWAESDHDDKERQAFIRRAMQAFEDFVEERSMVLFKFRATPRK